MSPERPAEAGHDGGRAAGCGRLREKGTSMSGIYRTTRGTGRDGGGDAAGARIRLSVRAGATASRARALRGPAFRAGAVAVITMLYMLLLSTLTLALFYAASYNVQVSDNFSGISRA